MGYPLALAKYSLLLTIAALATSANAANYVPIPAGSFSSVLSSTASNELVRIESFALREMPVTIAEYLMFLRARPDWQRGKVPVMFADDSYLRSWSGPTTIGSGLGERQAVTGVSWFAAQAFCENEGGRLPTWYEWEYVAAADEARIDARSDPAWRSRILSWYSMSSKSSLRKVGGISNYYGIRDMHGLIWEWVDDFNALFISADSRKQGDPDKLQFCGAGAISLQDRENYAVLMRVALLSSLAGADSTEDLGFRCARSHPQELQ